MATTSPAPEEIVRAYHHLLEEHRRARPEGAARRRFEGRLDELEARFERLLLEEVAEEERAAWRRRLHHGAPAPPVAPERALAFKGRSEAGSVVELRERPDGDYDVEIDGVPVDRLTDHIDFRAYVDGDREYPEVFDAAPEAIEALAAWVAAPEGEPPWQHVHDLLDDGLVDRYFGLTDRGRRAVRPS